MGLQTQRTTCEFKGCQSLSLITAINIGFYLFSYNAPDFWTITLLVLGELLLFVITALFVSYDTDPMLGYFCFFSFLGACVELGKCWRQKWKKRNKKHKEKEEDRKEENQRQIRELKRKYKQKLEKKDEKIETLEEENKKLRDQTGLKRLRGTVPRGDGRTVPKTIYTWSYKCRVIKD
jgi:exonuclease VII large subunit